MHEVLTPIVQRVNEAVQIAEARYFFGYQMMTMNIHAEAYARFSAAMEKICAGDTIYVGHIQRARSSPMLREWSAKWITPDTDVRTSLVAGCAMQWLLGSMTALVYLIGGETDLSACCRAIGSDGEAHCQFMCASLSYSPPSASSHRDMLSELLVITESYLAGESLFSPLSIYGIDGLRSDACAETGMAETLRDIIGFTRQRSRNLLGVICTGVRSSDAPRSTSNMGIATRTVPDHINGQRDGRRSIASDSTSLSRTTLYVDRLCCCTIFFADLCVCNQLVRPRRISEWIA